MSQEQLARAVAAAMETEEIASIAHRAAHQVLSEAPELSPERAREIAAQIGTAARSLSGGE